MNSLKPLVLMVVLGAVGYGVFVALHKQPPPPPPDVNTQWAQPSADLGMSGMGTPIELGTPSASLPASLAAGGSPSAGSLGGSFAAPAAPSAAAAAAGGDAPRFQPGAPAGNRLVPSERGVDAAGAGTGLFSPAGPPTGPGAAWPATAMPDGSDQQPLPASSAAPGAAAHGSPWPDVYADVQQAVASESTPAAAVGISRFAVAQKSAERLLREGKLVQALRELSVWYDHPDLTPAESQQLCDLLSQLAGSVIYSRHHLLMPPHIVQPGEDLHGIAQHYDVPWQLLAKINGIGEPGQLYPGEELKVVRGPFTAVVSTDRRWLTLTVGGLYAGRFDVAVGQHVPGLEGVYEVREKTADHAQLGRHWIGLTDGFGIHALAGPTGDVPGDSNGVELTPRDAAELFDILSIGSRVVVRR